MMLRCRDVKALVAQTRTHQRRRDRLIHGYFGVDSNLVWLTVKNRMPAAKKMIQALLAGL